MNTENKNHQQNEERLPQDTLSSDLDTFNQLILTCQDIAYHHAYVLPGDDALAEDVTQESLIKAFQQMKTFRRDIKGLLIVSAGRRSSVLRKYLDRHQFWTVLQRLRQTHRLDLSTPRQVGNRPPQFQDTVIGPRLQVEPCHRRSH
jgi:DNA-directed RNA polymerase specialized sigma24 family protein